jgi:hypothetical protein
VNFLPSSSLVNWIRRFNRNPAIAGELRIFREKVGSAWRVWAHDKQGRRLFKIETDPFEQVEATPRDRADSA